MTWYETAKSSIAQTKIDNPGLSRAELKTRCSQNYPFGVRKYYPYKAWLRAMKDEFGSKRQLQQAQKAGQCDMFL